MKKLLPLLLCLPLIGYTNFKDKLEEYEYYIGDVEIFEDKGYIQIKQDTSKIYFPDRYPGIVIYDTSNNGQRIIEYFYHQHFYLEQPFPSEKREWFNNGNLKYEFMRQDVKFPGQSYLIESSYSNKGDLIYERKLKLNGEEVGWLYLNWGFVFILSIFLLFPIFIFALYRIIRLFIFKKNWFLSLCLVLFVLYVLKLSLFSSKDLTYVLIFSFFVLICWIILGLLNFFNKNKSMNKD